MFHRTREGNPFVGSALPSGGYNAPHPIAIGIFDAACFAAHLCWLPLAVSAQDRAWIERSDRNAAMVFDVMGAFQPEWMSEVGIDRFDGRVMDLNPGAVQRFDAAARSLSTRLSAKRADEKDARVRFDLELLVDSLQRERTSRTLEERRLIPYFDVPRHVFQGLQVLLDER